MGTAAPVPSVALGASSAQNRVSPNREPAAPGAGTANHERTVGNSSGDRGGGYAMVMNMRLRRKGQPAVLMRINDHCGEYGAVPSR
jgi:hypothetical protein